MLQQWKSDSGFIYNGTTYYFDDIDSSVVSPQEAKHLTRGANSTNKVGLVYKEGSKTPWTITANVMNLSKEVMEILNKCYDEETRIDFFCVDSNTGENKMAYNSLVTKWVSQETISDGEDTYNVALALESFDVKPY
jgi:hypothetical protein|nr:MAG TPA: hypothetical protein [Caudoviricetes sp.]